MPDRLTPAQRRAIIDAQTRGVDIYNSPGRAPGYDPSAPVPSAEHQPYLPLPDETPGAQAAYDTQATRVNSQLWDDIRAVGSETYKTIFGDPTTGTPPTPIPTALQNYYGGEPGRLTGALNGYGAGLLRPFSPSAEHLSTHLGADPYGETSRFEDPLLGALAPGHNALAAMSLTLGHNAPLYHMSERIAQDLLARKDIPNLLSKPQALALLKNYKEPGATGATLATKPEELHWLGLNELLSGDGKISKADLLSHIEKNKVDVQLLTGTKNIKGDVPAPGSDFLAKWSPVDHPQYNYPGGENYRENLYQWNRPPQDPTNVSMESWLLQKYGPRDPSRTWDPKSWYLGLGPTDRMDVYSLYQAFQAGLSPISTTRFTGPAVHHYDKVAQDIIAHERIQDFTTSGGLATAHTEEAQSDALKAMALEDKLRKKPSDYPSFKFETMLRDAGYDTSNPETAGWSFFPDPSIYEAHKTAAPLITGPDTKGLPLPLAKSYMTFSARATIMDALARGKDAVSFTPSQSQAERWGGQQIIDNLGSVTYNFKTGTLRANDKFGNPVPFGAVDPHNPDATNIEQYIAPPDLHKWIGVKGVESLLKNITPASEVPRTGVADLFTGARGNATYPPPITLTFNKETMIGPGKGYVDAYDIERRAALLKETKPYGGISYNDTVLSKPAPIEYTPYAGATYDSPEKMVEDLKSQNIAYKAREVNPAPGYNPEPARTIIAQNNLLIEHPYLAIHNPNLGQTYLTSYQDTQHSIDAFTNRIATARQGHETLTIHSERRLRELQLQYILNEALAASRPVPTTHPAIVVTLPSSMRAILPSAGGRGLTLFGTAAAAGGLSALGYAGASQPD